MKDIFFPINFTFKVSTLHNDFTAQNVDGQTIAYVKQKMFKLKEEITIYQDEQKSTINYKINADKWLDFSAAYKFTKADGSELGKIARKGWASLWKAKYELVDQEGKVQYQVNEENGWVKVMDSFLGEIPILSFFTGYLFNPSYRVTDENDIIVARLKKEPSFWGRKFKVTKLTEFDHDNDERIILGLMMMILLERRRG